MKKLKELNTKIVFVFIAVFAISTTLNAQDWNLQSITQASNYYKPQMVLGPDGIPHIVFVSADNGRRDYYYGKWNGMAWDIEKVYTNQNSNQEAIPSLAVSDNNIPYLYFRELLTSALYYGGNIAYRDETQGWIITNYPVFEENDLHYSENFKLLLHENESTNTTEPIVLITRSNEGYYCSFNSSISEWSIEEIGPQFSEIHDAKITTAGDIYMTYRWDKSINFATYNGSTWAFLEIGYFTSYPHYSSIDFDNAGQPHISYYDPIEKCLKYARLGQNIQ